MECFEYRDFREEVRRKGRALEVMVKEVDFFLATVEIHEMALTRKQWDSIQTLESFLQITVENKVRKVHKVQLRFQYMWKILQETGIQTT